MVRRENQRREGLRSSREVGGAELGIQRVSEVVFRLRRGAGGELAHGKDLATTGLWPAQKPVNP
jgi:hypothetical protein